MNGGEIQSLYRAFGRLVHLYRKRRPGMTQEKLGELVGLSRTSITNIERGRQHIALHQLFALAEALNIAPDALVQLPETRSSPSWLAEKLPPGTDRALTEWAEKLVRK
jgi:transcriptional regulator with XRE-family HTH domain